MSAPESVAATGPSAALAPSVGEGAAALRIAVRPCIRKFGLNLLMSAIFAEEARKIQEGTSEEQNIYGTCTAEEQRELSEDGIDILPLPELPPEH